VAGVAYGVALGFPISPTRGLATDCVGIRAMGADIGLILAIDLHKYKSALCVYEPTGPFTLRASEMSVVRRRVGRAYYYKAVTRSRSAFRTMLSELVDTYCGGSIQALVMNIIRAERLSEDELLKLKKLAEDRDSERDPTPPPARRRSK
jgi:hypothetical protein